MLTDDEPLTDIAFTASIMHWRGPSPFYFAVVPDEHVGEVRYAARQASYGWGVVPVEAVINGIPFRTSLFPKDGGYLLPLKVDVRKRADIDINAPVDVEMRIAAKDSRGK
ncbi:MAG TPA: DUF1905 domain-containing protein [Sphingobium sp.]